ncbi:hypothetical protein SERLADRAFT_432125 [Serpula lacrymans var. lacrymans S7.9]|nr:uncharacterized protein SERLADRAFT_432125 [Serpula lacrymans var. lacrymans S7.9]EGO30552.1 hypothetical protein SERLADRAFT_432125 [Serpula lacrymans var. lacrymans S7.9]
MRSPSGCPGEDTKEVPIIYETPISPASIENNRSIPPHMDAPQRMMLGCGQQLVLSNDQERLVWQAELMLTKHTLNDPEEGSNRHKGPSKPKGKGPDPSNWGNLLNESNMDIDKQKKAFYTWKEAQYWAQEKFEVEKAKEELPKLKAKLAKELKKNKSAQPDASVLDRENPVARLVEQMVKPTKGQQTLCTPHKLNPSNQIPAASYLRRLLGHIKLKGNKPSELGSSLSESDSSSHGDLSESSSDEDSRTSSLGHKKGTRTKHAQRKRMRRQILKPTEPPPYDRKLHLREFHCFVTAATAYVTEGQVPHANRVYMLSIFLKGKAYEFYIQEVANNPFEWTLQ